CVKCQKFDGHLAHACTSPVDVCGRCAEAHRTTNCPVTDSGTMRCANCKVSGHGAAERECPFFQEAQRKRRERDPTSGYRYIPTSDPRTWVTTETMASAPPQPIAGGSGQGHGRLAGGARGQGGSAPGRERDEGWEGRAR
ncbi:hypothetical protein K438DRAFT_1493073, partial [Mycena galopus ATCC 62051]